MNSGEPQLEFDRLQRLFLMVGVVALAVCALGGYSNRAQFFQSYLVAYLFWIGIALGCVAILMLQHLTGGAWGLVIRRILESGTTTLPLMAALAVPLLLGLHDLYSWTRPEVLAGDPILRHKQIYLNVPFFLTRMAFYFAAWFALAYFLNKWSTEQDRTGDPSIAGRLQGLSGAGLVLYGFTVTFASVDWVMSLEPHWFSTIYGMLFIVGQALATMAFVIAVLTLLGNRKPLSETVTASHFHDLGTLLFAFVMLWAYISFSQFLIIWAGNTREEIPWYLRRFAGGWLWLALLILLFHFALPFLLLLSRTIKSNRRVLAAVAIALLVMRLVDLYWLVIPGLHQQINWMDFAAPVGVGGLWGAAFIWNLKRRPLLPLHDSRLSEATHHG